LVVLAVNQRFDEPGIATGELQTADDHVLTTHDR
jgi:hypothetical protein